MDLRLKDHEDDGIWILNSQFSIPELLHKLNHYKILTKY